MESPDLFSVWRGVTRPIFASLGLEGFRSRNFEYCKEMVFEISVIQIFLFVVFAGKKTKT